jgi:hypothetical protein
MPKPGRKGRRNEYYLRDLHRALGIEATRVVCSGSLGNWLPELRGDLRLIVPAVGLLVCEVKARKCLPKTLTKWLAANDALLIRGDRREPLVCLPWRTWVRLLRARQATERTTP